MLLVLTIAAAVWLGYELAVRYVDRSWAAALLVGSSIWIATVWAAALLHVLNRPVLIARTLLMLAAAIVLFRRRAFVKPAFDRAYVLPAIPLLAWIGFVLWRTSLTPPLTHDALAYHLPRAVLWMRAGGFTWLDLSFDPRVRLLPANYEMLLADAMLLGGSDRLTEWVAVFFFIAFVAVCGALARRWWNDSRAALATMLLAASVPVLLLHAGADKNDVMTAFFLVSALLWGGRWVGDKDLASLVLCITAIAAAIGTKPQGVILAVVECGALAPLLLRKSGGKPPHSKLIIFGAVAFALLGGAQYVTRFLHGSAEQQQFVAYDDWANLWQAPWVLVAAPFSRTINELWVPWSAKPWFWHRDELFFSSLGIPFVLCLFAAPFFARNRERGTMSIAAAIVFLLMLPVRDVPMPHGVYVVALPRYVLFLVAIVFALAVPPLVKRAPRLMVGALALWFTYSAVFAVLNDRFIPLNYLQYAMEHRGTRLVAFDFHRAAVVADTVAGDRDLIAIDAGYGAWIHPAFGPRLTRPVVFLKPGQPIPENADWVLVDRAWHLIWQGPGFRDISQWRTHLGHGQPAAEDVRLLNALKNDPRFELVFYKAATNQAVFRRRR